MTSRNQRTKPGKKAREGVQEAEAAGEEEEGAVRRGEGEGAAVFSGKGQLRRKQWRIQYSGCNGRLLQADGYKSVAGLFHFWVWKREKRRSME